MFTKIETLVCYLDRLDIVATTKTMDEALLTPQTISRSSSRLTSNSFCLGFVTGIFIQLSTVGSYALTVLKLGHEYMDEHTAILALLWSILFSSLGLCTLMSTTGMIVDHEVTEKHGDKRNDNYSNRICTTVESHFLAGSMSSLSISFFLLSYVLVDQVRWDIGFLGLAMVLLYWHAPKLFLDLVSDDDDQHEEENYNGYGIANEDMVYKGEDA